MKFNCPHCSQKIEAPDEFAGTDANCPACRGAVSIPKSESSAASSSLTEADILMATSDKPKKELPPLTDLPQNQAVTPRDTLPTEREIIELEARQEMKKEERERLENLSPAEKKITKRNVWLTIALWRNLVVALFMAFVTYELIQMRSELSSIESDVWDIERDTSSIERDLSSIESDVWDIERDVSSIEGDVSSIEGEVDSIKKDVKAIMKKFDIYRPSFP